MSTDGDQIRNRPIHDRIDEAGMARADSSDRQVALERTIRRLQKERLDTIAVMSASRLQCLFSCGEQFRRKYIEREKSLENLVFTRGKAVHHGVAVNMQHQIDHGRLLEVDQVVEESRDYFVKEIKDKEWRITGKLYEEMTHDQIYGRIIDEVCDLARVHAVELAPQLKPVLVEQRLTIPANPDTGMPGWLMFLDLVECDGTVRDTKTAGKSPDKTAADTSIQLTIYSMGSLQHFGFVPEKLTLDYVVRTPTGKTKVVVLETTRTDKHVEVVEHRVRAAMAMVKAGAFIPAPHGDWKCGGCEFAETCKFKG